MDATAFVTTTLRHVQSRCAQLYSAHPGAAESDSLLCSQAPGTLPEVDVKRVSNELYCKPVLGITPNTNVLHVHIDGNIHAAFKQMTIQDHYAELYLPHLRGSYTASTEEQVRVLGVVLNKIDTLRILHPRNRVQCISPPWLLGSQMQSTCLLCNCFAWPNLELAQLSSLLLCDNIHACRCEGYCYGYKAACGWSRP